MWSRFFYLLLCCLFFSCKNQNNATIKNTFYISYISNSDSLLSSCETGSDGKVSFIDAKNEIQILPINYLTEERSNLHYFKLAKSLSEKPQIGSIKYIVKFNDSVYHHNIAYELSKYVYLKKGWELQQSKGSFAAYQNLRAIDSTLPYRPKRLASRVLKHIVEDSYGK